MGGDINTENTNPAQFREIIIPGDVLDDDRLSDGAKIIYGKIARLSVKTGYCWATNAFLSNTKSGETAKRQIKELIDAGYLTSQIENGYIRKLYICKIDSKVEKDPRVKNDPPPRSKMTHPRVKDDPPPQVKNDPQTLQDSTNLNLTAAAGPPETSTPDKKPAAAAPITPQELKEALLALDKALFLKTAFYPKAAAFMAQYGLDRGYIAWMYRQCEQRKPSSLNGLYYVLFFEQDMAEQYAAGRKVQAALQLPPPPVICPACGEAHAHSDDKCPSCGLRKDAPQEQIQLFSDLHSFPPEKRAEYLRRQDAILEECGKDFVKFTSMINGLNNEFGIAAGL
jgi:rubrerythrin